MSQHLQWPEERPLQPRPTPLSLYVPFQGTSEGDSAPPCQIVNNPFRNNVRIPTVSNHSLSKWACTEMSTQENKDEDSFLHIDSPPPCIELELLAEATFKPKELKQQLRSNNDLKEVLKQTLGTKQNKILEKEKPSNAVRRDNSKTRYQKILQEYFHKKEKPENFTSKMKLIPNLKQKYTPRQESAPILKEKIQMKPKQKIKTKQQIVYQPEKYEKQIPKSYKITKNQRTSTQINLKQTQTMQNKLTKTFSQPSLSHRNLQETESLDTRKRGEGWMRLSFTQRQQRVLSSRREKENKGKQLNMEKQIRECTFKPVTKAYRPTKTEATAESYAKMYLEKVRKRL